MGHASSIFLAVIFVAASISLPAFAETLVKSTNFEKSTILEFTNNDNTPLKTVRVWLGASDGTFKSFKTEKGWTGIKTPQGVLVFSTENPLGLGQSVKFGVKTEISHPAINWKTIDSNGNEISIGKVEAKSEATIKVSEPAKQEQPPNLDNAVFKIIPNKPKNGDSIRIVGEKFPPNKLLSFEIDGQKMTEFTTNKDGKLIGRAKIPETKAADRVEFSLADENGNKKTISLRIEHRESQMVSNTKRLVVEQFTEVVKPGQNAFMSGTGQPGSTVSITTTDLNGTKIYEAVTQVDSQGRWSHQTTIPPDAQTGPRKVVFSDGQNKVEKTVNISLLTTINIKASALKYNPGEKMVFNGTAVPGKPLQVVINDPIGKEIFSDVLTVSNSGVVNFEYKTEATSTKGTYTATFSQDTESQTVRVGLGELPSEQIIAKFDKLTYSTAETAKLSLQGPPKVIVSLLIVDPSDRVKLTDSVPLGADGKGVYELKLSDYKTGVYSAVVKYQKFQNTLTFSVGLQTTSGQIQMQTTKSNLQLGEGILVLGSTSPNSLLKLELFGPDGNSVKKKDIFSDKSGKFSDGTFRIPADAKDGTWVLRASSGSNYAEVKLLVSGTVQQGFAIRTDKTSYNAGETLTIYGSGGGKSQTTIIQILDSKNSKIVELTINTTSTGSFQTIWNIPKDLISGTYKVNATVGGQTAEATFTVK